MATDSEDSQVQLARMRVGDTVYAIDLMKVREVVPPQHVQPVPGAPTFVVGLLELRGDFLPVIDLRQRLGGDAEPEAEHRIVIATVRDRRVGYIVDEVFDVFRVPLNAIRPIDDLARTAAVSGIVKDGQGTVFVLEPDGILSDLESSALESLPGADPAE